MQPVTTEPATTQAAIMPPGVQLSLEQFSKQEAEKKEAPDAKTREVRLGLVLYGGVSLAIYINGVANEFARAVRGQGVYRWVKALTDSDVVVDVVSGTSAGGINGLALAFALCNETKLDGLATLWRERGDLKGLLRDPNRDTPTVHSLLDSETKYQKYLEDAFVDLGRCAYTAKDGDHPSSFDELDVFITGTDLEGTHRTQFDDAGHPIDVKDHLTLFLLKHRAGRKKPKEPFKPEAGGGTGGSGATTTHRALATLARITSTFPAAFAPVRVDSAPPGDGSVEAKLHLWGQIAAEKTAYFVDGGVVNNHPFTATIKTIFSRTAEREVDRKLFYVEPDPAEVKAPAPAKEPNLLQTVLASRVGIPAYQGIAEDLALLEEHNRKLDQYDRLVRDLERMLPSTPATAPDLPALYRRSRMVALSDRVIQGIFRLGGQEVPVDRADRDVAASLVRFLDDYGDSHEKDSKRILHESDVYFRLRRLMRVVYRIHELLYKDDPAAPEPEQAARYQPLLRALNRHVEAHEIVQAALERLIDEAEIPWRGMDPTMGTGPASIWIGVQRLLGSVLNTGGTPPQGLDAGYVVALSENRTDDVATRLDDLHGWLGARCDKVTKELSARLGKDLIVASDDQSEEQRNQIRDKNDQEKAARFAATPGPPQGPGLLEVLDDHTEELFARFGLGAADPVHRTYANFEALDAQLFPLELVGRLAEKDRIETIRISPRDAQRGFSEHGLSDKVAGEVVYHFGAFFKRSWRSNDILWGRLDGSCQLIETLLDRERIREIVAHDAWRERIRRRFFGDGAAAAGRPGWLSTMDPADKALFQHTSPEARDELKTWLEDLLSADPERRHRALDEKKFDGAVDLLIEAAQFETIVQHLPDVFDDAIAEQNAWNRYQVERGSPPRLVQPVRRVWSGKPDPKKKPPPPWVFAHSGHRRADPFVAITSTAQRLRESLATFAQNGGTATRPREAPLGEFFRNKYEVGSEQLLRDIPTPVLLGLLAHALLVLRNALIGLFGDNAPRVKRNPLYRFGLSLPLQVFYRSVLLWQRSPGVWIGLHVGVTAIAAVLLAVGIAFWRQIVWPEGDGLDLRWLVLFILAPLAVVYLQVRWLLEGRRAIARALIAVLLAVAAIVAWRQDWLPSDVDLGWLCESSRVRCDES